MRRWEKRTPYSARIALLGRALACPNTSSGGFEMHSKENDTMNGTATEDWMSGGAGADLMYGFVSTDFLFGQNGGDTLHGGKGADALYGEFGNDTLHGGPGGDEMRGDDDWDWPNRPDGHDRLYGGEGNDHMWGYYGDDTLLGGDGDDEISAFDDEEFTGGEDFVNCGKGHDVVIFDKEFDKVRNCEIRRPTDGL